MCRCFGIRIMILVKRLFYKRILLFIFFLSNILNFSFLSAITEQEINRLYRNVYGAVISDKEEEAIRIAGGDPTYGEITFSSVTTLLSYLQLKKEDVFYDLGCGVGKMVVQVCLNSCVKKSVGIELSLKRYDHTQNISKKLGSEEGIYEPNRLEFRHENILDSDLSDATIIYMCSTCFPEKMMEELTEKLSKLKKGLVVISLKPLAENDSFKLVLFCDLPVDWNGRGARFYFYELN